jgi:hypothetical protein
MSSTAPDQQRALKPSEQLFNQLVDHIVRLRPNKEPRWTFLFMTSSCGLAAETITVDQLRAQMDEQGLNPPGMADLYKVSNSMHKAICASYGVAQATRPVASWPINPHSEMGQMYMRSELANVLASAEVLNQLHDRMVEQRPKELLDLIVAMTVEFMDLAPLWIDTFRMHSGAEREFSADYPTLHPAGVHFTTSDGYDYAHYRHGALVKQGDRIVYGNGYLNGRELSIPR